MIELDYKLRLPDWLMEDRARIKDYPFVALETGFQGDQLFSINGVYLGSNSIGIIAFAATLLLAVKRFDAGEDETIFYDLDSPWRVYFKRTGDNVEVSTSSGRGPVTVRLGEFKNAVLPYIARVRKELSAQFPELRHNQTFLDVLNEQRQAA